MASSRGSALHLAGGIAALLIGVLYVVIIALYAQVGPAPADGAAVLAYLVGKGTVWWGIVLLSVLTDLLFVPLALSLYVAPHAIGRSTMLVASALMVVFVPLDLAVTWTNHAVLLDLSALHSAATTDAQRAAAVAAATYASAVIASPLFPIYAIGTLSFAIFLMGLVMRRSRFGRIAAISHRDGHPRLRCAQPARCGGHHERPRYDGLGLRRRLSPPEPRARGGRGCLRYR